MKTLKRMAVVIVIITLAMGLVASTQVNNDSKNADFTNAFEHFVNNMYADTLSTKCATYDVDTTNAMQAQLNLISKHTQYMHILKVGKTLIIETDRDIYDDTYPFEYITYKLEQVKDLRHLNPEAFANFNDNDYCLFVQEEYGTSSHNKTLITQRAIVFAYDNYNVLAAVTILANRCAIS